MKETKYSIIIPTHNRKEKLENCLKSLVNSGFNKDLGEIIVVENGSNKARDIKNKFPIKYFNLKEPNVSKARNFGVEKAKYDQILFIEDDIIVSKKFIDYLQKTKIKNPVMFKPTYSGKNIYSIIYQIIFDTFIKQNTTNSMNDLETRINFLFNYPEKPGKEIKKSCPLGVFTITKKDFLTTSRFDKSLKRLQDIKFTGELIEKGIKIELNSRFEINHESKENFREFINFLKNNARYEMMYLKQNMGPKSIFLTFLGKTYDLVSWIKELRTRNEKHSEIFMTFLLTIISSIYVIYLAKSLIKTLNPLERKV